MPNLINLPLGRTSLTIFGLSLFLSFWLASFGFFRKTREEFDTDERIVSLLLSVLLGWVIGSRLSYFLGNLGQFARWSDVFLLWRQPGLSWAGGYWGIIAAVWLWGKKNQFQIAKLADGGLIPLLILNLGFFVGQWLCGSGTFYLFGLGIIILSLPIAYWALKAYRSLTWYPSGKIGFALLFTNSFLFLGLALLAFLTSSDLYLETALNLTVFIWSVVTLFLRSGSQSANLASKRVKELTNHDQPKGN